MVHALAVAEFCVISLLSFVHASDLRRMFRESSDPILHNSTCVIMPLGRRVREFIDDMCSNTILEGCPLDKINAYLVYRHSEDVAWAALRMEAHFLLYDFSSGYFSHLSETGP